MNENATDALQLCRNLLAFTAPGVAVTVPHAALAQVVELASGTVLATDVPASEPLAQLYDVAALAKRYNRAPATVRQWFAAGLFGPPGERLFRGRGYVASAEEVRAFEMRSSEKNANHGEQRAPGNESAGAALLPASRVRRPQRGGRADSTSSTIGMKIRAAAQPVPSRGR